MQTARMETSSQPRHPMRVSEHRSKDDMIILATHRFCDIDSHNRLSLGQFTEAFNLLVGQVTSATRQIIARRLAHSTFTPRSVALYLAMEPFSVAMPILAHSQALGQLDLLRLVDRLDIEYARAIATRLDVGPSLLQHLKTLGDDDVQIALEDNDALMGNLETRSADALFVEIDARENRAGTSTQSGPEKAGTRVQPIAKAPPAPAPINAAEHALLAAADRGRNIKMPPMARPMENEFDFGKAFEKAARARSHQAMAVLMQKRFNLALATAHQVLQDKTGDTLAVLLNAAEVEPALANRIQLLTHANIGLSAPNARRALNFYAKLNSGSSRAAIEQWPKAKDPQIHHEPHLESGRERRADVNTGSSKPEQSTAQPIQAAG